VRPVLRLAGRVVAAGIAVLVAGVVAIQFARAIGENVSAARELSSIRTDIAALQKRRDEQQQELRRLRDPQGAIPEIHDRLRLVRPNEALIFVSPQPAAPSSNP
jgi:septal ring factor EnvC (AmiA/AmiB activator)